MTTVRKGQSQNARLHVCLASSKVGRWSKAYRPDWCDNAISPSFLEHVKFDCFHIIYIIGAHLKTSKLSTDRIFTLLFLDATGVHDRQSRRNFDQVARQIEAAFIVSPEV